ncbi:MAG: glycosyltransferase [Pseudomonadota bacterium]
MSIRSGSGGQEVGRLLEVEVKNSEIRVLGTCDTAIVNLSTEVENQTLVPIEGSFEATLSGNRQLVVRAGTDGEPQNVRLYTYVQYLRNLARSGLGLLEFAFHWRDIANYVMLGDSAAGNRLEQLIAPLTAEETLPKAVPNLFERNSSSSDLLDPVDVIVPIYNAFDDVGLCLERLASNTPSFHRVFLINDASTDPRVHPLLVDAVSRRESWRLITNGSNEGFVKSVNKGLSKAHGHVVLLNSDAFVPPDWIDRLVKPLTEDSAVASVTPMSSDAEIMTAPIECSRFVARPGEALELDKVAKKLNPQAAIADLPTGVGFCMALNAHFLQQVPLFDEVFGSGYGEEVDWCRKTAALGGRHIGIGTLYVEHRGGGSFGTEKLKRVQKNNRIINKRYPFYDESVARFRNSDPLVAPRLALALASISSPKSVRVFVSQRLGGGSEYWLDEQISISLSDEIGSVVLRQPASGSDELVVEVHCPSGVTRGRVPASELPQYLDLLQNRQFVFSCLVNADDPLAVTDRVTQCLRSGDSIDVLLHDYFAICPSYNLLSYKGDFCRLPSIVQCQHCYERLPQTSGQRPTKIKDWRDAWSTLLNRADKVVAFSSSSADLFAQIWPNLTPKIVLKPHDLPVQPTPVHPSGSRPVTLGVLGAIGEAKGARIVNGLARGGRDQLSIVVIGKLDPAYSHNSILVHGQYEQDEISDLASRYGLSGWLIPSVWPETFCYTAHECLSTGLPVFAFDIGAQGEAMSAHENGYLIPYGAENTVIQSTVLSVLREENSMACQDA